nr:hypothetical protein [Candidatus Enterovibrio escacola]
MESYHYRHHLGNGEAKRFLSLFNTGRNWVFLPCREESLAEIIDIDENSL